MKYFKNLLDLGPMQKLVLDLRPGANAFQIFMKNREHWIV